MDQEINAGYIITDRLTTGNSEFVIGERENAPAKFVTMKCSKGKKNYHWGHYFNERLTALEDLCNRVLDEIHFIKGLNHEKDIAEKPFQQAQKEKHAQER